MSANVKLGFFASRSIIASEFPKSWTSRSLTAKPLQRWSSSMASSYHAPSMRARTMLERYSTTSVGNLRRFMRDNFPPLDFSPRTLRSRVILLGQRADGKLLSHAQGGVCAPGRVPYESRGELKVFEWIETFSRRNIFIKLSKLRFKQTKALPLSL